MHQTTLSVVSVYIQVIWLLEFMATGLDTQILIGFAPDYLDIGSLLKLLLLKDRRS